MLPANIVVVVRFAKQKNFGADGLVARSKSKTRNPEMDRGVVKFKYKI